MNGNLSTGPTLHDQYPEATEWLFKVLRSLEAPAHMREAVNELKGAINLYLTIPDARLQALMRPPTRTPPRSALHSHGAKQEAVGVSCPTCGHATQVVATEEKCPRCTKPMIMRKNRTNGQAFLGCSGYPVCMGTKNLQNLIVERANKRALASMTNAEEPMRLIEIN